MKSLVALFAGEISGYGLEPLVVGASAFEQSVNWARKVPDVSRIVVFTREEGPGCSEITACIPSSDGYLDYDICRESDWTVASFLARLTQESEGFDHVFLVWADCPFLDAVFTGELFKKHIKYAAEYTFADGYPYGLAPEILARGIIPILSTIAKDNNGPVTRNLVFETVKKEINSFDIETDIAPTDLRQLRLSLACDTKRNSMLCRTLIGVDASNYAEMIKENSNKLRTLPAFYAIQVAGRCPFECEYCPYPAYCRSGKGSSPGKAATDRTDEMSVENFSSLIRKISDFSEDAVVSLSLWGESAYHSGISSLVKTVLSFPNLSVLIETTGIGWKDADIEAISLAETGAAPRSNGQKALNWIVSLDAIGGPCYASVHGVKSGNSGIQELGESLLREALSFVERISALFPGTLWPQMVRMNDNETELEAFYRFWKQKTGQVIIQKHDHFCGSIQDRRVADLSPLVRHPCWHLKRDMSILIDGSVPLCREDLYAARSYGNAFREDLSVIWAGAHAIYEQQTNCVYEGMCGACDEYYTYNF
jgi:spiro-SPASM protein